MTRIAVAVAERDGTFSLLLCKRYWTTQTLLA